MPEWDFPGTNHKSIGSQVGVTSCNLSYICASLIEEVKKRQIEKEKGREGGREDGENVQ